MISLILWRQFDPAFGMLSETIRNCPNAVWNKRVGAQAPVWQHVLHTLTGIAFWFRSSGEEFAIPDFGKGVTPDLDQGPGETPAADEILGYLAETRRQAQAFVEGKSDEQLLEPCAVYEGITNCDVILMQIRHFQHHIGYCNRLLAAAGARPAAWQGFGE